MKNERGTPEAVLKRVQAIVDRERDRRAALARGPVLIRVNGEPMAVIENPETPISLFLTEDASLVEVLGRDREGEVVIAAYLLTYGGPRTEVWNVTLPWGAEIVCTFEYGEDESVVAEFECTAPLEADRTVVFAQDAPNVSDKSSFRPLVLAAQPSGGARVEMASAIVSSAEQEMVARAKRGEPEVWEEIYKQHMPSVFRLEMQLVKNRAIAEELTQEVFTRAFGRIGGFQRNSTLGTWLHCIAANTALRYLARLKRQTSKASVNLAQFSDGGRQAEYVEETQDIRTIEKAIRCLPDSERIAVTLHYLYDWSYLELAELMGVTQRTVRSECLHGLKKLREALTLGVLEND